MAATYSRSSLVPRIVRAGTERLVSVVCEAPCSSDLRPGCTISAARATYDAIQSVDRVPP